MDTDCHVSGPGMDRPACGDEGGRRNGARLAAGVLTAAALAVVAGYYLVRFRDTLAMFFFLDDFWNISEAAQIDVRSLGDVGQFLRPTHNGFTLYRPLTQTDYFFALRALFGYDATGYHAVQLCAHIVTAWLALLITRRLSNSTWVGLAGALIYAGAPGHWQAVYWVSAFTMTGTTLILLGMLWLWLATAGWLRVVGVTVAQVAALLAGEHGVIGPLLLAALAWLGPAPEPSRRVIRHLALPALLVGAYVVAKIIYIMWLHPMPPGFPYAPSFDTAGWVQRTGRYAIACVPALSLLDPGTAAKTGLGAALMLAVPAAAWLRLRRGTAYSLAALGSAIFVIGLLPVLPLAGHAYDYYIGTAAFGAALLVLGLCRLTGRHWRPVAVAVAAAVVLLDLRTREVAIRRDDNVQLIIKGSAVGARWISTISRVAGEYPQINEVFIPTDVVTHWMVASGGHRVFLPPRPIVSLFDARHPPAVRDDQAIVWRPAANPAGDDAVPGATPQLRWLREFGR